MSIRARIEDAQALYRIGRRDGAILSILVAVAATSKKRYPAEIGFGDKQSFVKFVDEEMHNIIEGAVGRSGIYIQPTFTYYGKRMTLAEILYKYVRCNLAHEGRMPDSIRFEPRASLYLHIADEEAVLSENLLNGLIHAVVKAPENAEEFSDFSGRDQRAHTK